MQSRPVRLSAMALSMAGLLLTSGCDESGHGAAGGKPPAGASQHAGPGGPGGPGGAPEVSVVTVVPRAVPLSTELPGRVTAFRVAEIRPQVGGVVLHRTFREGETVRSGQLLYQIDPAPYEASLASARATLARAQATTASANLTVARYRPLVQAQAISRQDLDNAVASAGQGQADVASGQAGVRTAEINLAYTKVTSPIDGRTGRSSVTEGALLTSGQSTALVTVTQLDPIYVDVTQPSATMLRLQRERAAGTLSPDGSAEVSLVLPDGTDYDTPGRLQFSEVTVDQGTGSVTLRALFPNPRGILLPGMFVRQRLQEGVDEHGLLVPQQAVTRNQRGEPTVLLVDKDDVVQPRTIGTDRAVGHDWLVTAGLAAGDRVLVEGSQKARPGAKVKVVPFKPPPAALADNSGTGR